MGKTDYVLDMRLLFSRKFLKIIFKSLYGSKKKNLENLSSIGSCTELHFKVN